MEYIISAQNLKKQYIQGDTTIDAVNIDLLNIQEGKITAIIGRSGSGKSTLLHLLGGMDTPTQGTVNVKGISLYEKKKGFSLTKFRAKEIGFVFQEFNLIPELSVLDNIRLPLKILNIPYDLNFEKEIVGMLELDNRLSFYPNQISGGQQQRVAIARALVGRASVVLADEPTGNIDQAVGRRLMEYIRYSNETYHQTFVIVTHDPMIAEYAHSQICISDGRIE